MILAGTKKTPLGFMHMEEICASKALEWTREFDSALASGRTGAECEAVMNLAPRLLHWSLQPPANEAAADIFKLAAGQESARVNGMLVSRLGVMFKQGGHRNVSHSSLVSKERISNHVELVQLVLTVCGSSDLTARCLALRLIGCMAELCSDSSEVHRLVFKSLGSSEEPEVEAALYAAGCICDFTESFATVCFEKIKPLVSSIHTPSRLRSGSIRIFSRMWRSSELAIQTYETGKELMLQQPHENIVKSTLKALSQLSKRHLSVLRDHLLLLVEYAVADPRTSVKQTSLLLLAKLLEVCRMHVELLEIRLDRLNAFIGEIDGASDLRVLALRVLEKATRTRVLWSNDLISMVELNALDQDVRVRFQACSLLVALVHKFECSKETTGTVRGVDLVTRVALLLCDQIATVSAEDYNEMRRLCQLVVRLVQACPRASYPMVECLSRMVQTLLPTERSQVDASGDTVMTDVVDTKNVQKAALYCRCLDVCCKNADAAYTSEDHCINGSLKKVLDVLMNSANTFDDIFVRLTPVLSYHLREVKPGDVSIEKLQVIADGLLQSSKFWEAYKLAKTSCFYGLWSVAGRIFEALTYEVTLEASYFWLKTLQQVCSAEAALLETGPNLQSSQGFTLLEASVKSLQAGIQPDRSFEFQRRFIKLRIHLLQLTLDLTALCERVRLLEDEAMAGKFLQAMYAKAQVLVSRSQDLAEDFYVLTLSFMGMDARSMDFLLARMFQCSLLAVCTVLAFLPATFGELKRPHKAGVFTELRRFVDGDGRFPTFLLMLERVACGHASYRENVTQSMSEAMNCAWKQLVELKAEVVAQTDGVVWSREKGIPLLRKVLVHLSRSAWVLPKFFFNTRPRVQLELFVSQSGVVKKKRQEHILVTQGSALSLNLGLKIVNATPALKLREVSCILAVSLPCQTRGSCGQLSPPSLQTSDGQLLKWLDNLSQWFCSCTLDTTGLPPGTYELSCSAVGTDNGDVSWILLGPSVSPKFRVTTE